MKWPEFQDPSPGLPIFWIVMDSLVRRVLFHLCWDEKKAFFPTLEERPMTGRDGGWKNDVGAPRLRVNSHQ